MLQSARATKRWHGNAFAPVGARNRAICDTSRLTSKASRALVELVNDAFLWQLSPIRERQCRRVLDDHRTCHELPDSAPCCRAAILEIAFDDSTVQFPASDPETKLDGEGDRGSEPASLPPGRPLSLSTGVGMAGAAETKPVYRSIMTRAGWLTYLHHPGGGQNERRIRKE